jgi:ubiquitin fusion degradation protein 1
MNFGWGGNFGGMPSRFEEQYHCYSMAYAEKGHLEGGDKILLPQSALDTLARLNVDYPMLFRLQSSEKGTMTHCGVLEFSAQEGSCFIPYWMMQNLLIEEGSVISITNVSLPKATFVKLQPQHVDFLEITNPRAVLEHALRNFSCVTKGDVIQLPFNNKNYHFELKEVKPQDAACIIETDCNVDFDAPVGYKEPERNVSSGNVSRSSSLQSGSGTGADDSLLATLKDIPKVSPIAGPSSGTTPKKATDSNEPKLKIVDGKIVRPEDNGNLKQDEDIQMMAEKTGGTGVQPNAAIPVKAPEVNYWAVNAGDGARLDGKKATTLKDSQGNEIDIRKVRAEAAARRLEAKAKEDKEKGQMPTSGKMVNGKTVEEVANNTSAQASTAPTEFKRKSRTGSKFSKLKKSGGYAFQGTAKTFKK